MADDKMDGAHPRIEVLDTRPSTGVIKTQGDPLLGSRIHEKMDSNPDATGDSTEEDLAKSYQAFSISAETTHTDMIAQPVDPAGEVEDLNIVRQKIVNEEYKVWKKHAPFLYDIMMSRALKWPTLTTQWFPDKQTPPGEKHSLHRLLMGTHTENDEPNYLQIAQISIPDLTPDPDEYNEETGELGGYGGAGSKPQPEMKFDVMQRIDHPGEVNKARYMPQKPDVICTMAPDGRSLIFDRTKHSSNPTGRVEADLELVGHTAEGFGLGWNPNVEGQIATGSNDKTVKVWNLKDFTRANKILKPTTTLKYHSAIVNDLEYHHKFQWMLATVSDDLSLCIADLRTPASANPARRVPNAHADDINSVAFNQGTDTLLATGSADKTVAMWDLRNLDQKLHVCESHKDAVTGLEWHPFERQVLASSSIDRRVIFWDLARCGEEQSPEDAEDGPPELLFIHGGHTDRIADFSFNKNDPWLMASAAEDNLLQVWNVSKALVGKDMADVPLEELQK